MDHIGGWLRRGLPVWLAVLGLVFGLLPADEADAHAYVERSVPVQESRLEVPPQEIRVKFTEAIDPRLSRLVLKDNQGRTIQGEQSSEDGLWLILKVPELSNGVYQVQWQVLSLDTHVTSDSFRFSVGVDLPVHRPSDTISLDEVGQSGGGAGGQTQGGQGGQDPAAPPADADSGIPPVPGGAQGTGQDAQPGGGAGSSPGRNQGGDEGSGSSGSTGGSSAPVASPADDAPAAGAEESAPPDEDPAAAAGTDPDMAGEGSEAIGDTGGKPDMEEVASGFLEAAHDHHDHHHGHEHGGWHTILRILEIMAAVLVAGVIYYKLLTAAGPGQAGRASRQSAVAERTVYAGVFLLFAATGVGHVLSLTNELASGLVGQDLYWTTARVVLTSTSLGLVSMIRPALLGVLLFLSFNPNREERWPIAVQLLCAAGLILTFPYTGHAAASGTVAISAHTVHMLFAALWAGGIGGLVLQAMRLKPESAALQQWDHMLRRFSRAALPSIAAVTAAGIWLAYDRLGAWTPLFTSSYGLLIVAKSALLGCVIALGLFHRRVLMPRIAGVDAGGSGPEAGAAASHSLQRLVWGVRLELLLAIALLVLSGMLSTGHPPH